MTYRIALCDDEQTSLDFIAALVRSWAEQAGQQAEISAFESAEAFLFHYAERRDFDILLLDIEMGGLDGVSLARRVRRDNETVQIVFITGYSDYISDGYEVAALHYLMKPVDRDKLFAVLDRAALKLRKNERVLTLSLPEETVRVPLYEVRYLDVHQNYVTVHGKEDHTVKKPLRELEPMLDDRFFRVGRSFVVNLSKVRRAAKREAVLESGSVIPLPRGGYEALNHAILRTL